MNHNKKISTNEKTIQSITEYNYDTINRHIKTSIDKLFNEGEQGHESLLKILIQRRLKQDKDIFTTDALIFRYLLNSQYINIVKKLKKSFPSGIIPPNNNFQLNYKPLQELLIEHKFQEADKMTQEHLCQLAGLDKNPTRKWLYFTDISFIPCNDLIMIDLLWNIYSQGKFGFSVQKHIWIANKYNWNKLISKIGWLNNGNMRRYPQEFIWTIDAPKGHLPLCNQLRGNQTLSSLFEHIVWHQTSNMH